MNSNMIFNHNAQLYTIVLLLSMLTITGTMLSSIRVSADDDSVVDHINITVPVSCTLGGTGMNTHNATINNGQYDSAIGETVMKALCNDSEGFAIYAIGYTDDTDGKNVLTNSGLGSDYDITTGMLVSGNNSQWAMKLSAVSEPSPTYPVMILDSFDSFHIVPEDYTLVAKRTSSTDVGINAEGSTLKSTYQAYISKTQPAGTYTGQVKYTLVHPNYVSDENVAKIVTILFKGNGLSFADGSNTNTVKYANICEPEEIVYTGITPTIAKTDNINNDGIMETYNTSGEEVEETVTISGAYKLKVVLRYGIDADGNMEVYKDGNSETGVYYNSYWSNDWDTEEKKEKITFFVDSDTVSFRLNRYDEPTSDYYGYYAQVYPVYSTEQINTVEENILGNNCHIRVVSGRYEETTEWYGKWKTMQGNTITYAEDEESLIDLLSNRDWFSPFESYEGTTVEVEAHNPVTFDMVFASAEKTKLNGYYTMQDLSKSMCGNVTVDETTDVIDLRDNNVYTVGKLRDGNCWMIDDLQLDVTNSLTASKMSMLNTNATNEAIYNYLNGGNPGGNDGWSSSPISDATGSSTYTGPVIRRSVNQGVQTIKYNYCAANIGTYCYPSSGATEDSWPTQITYDICPSGWKLIDEIGDLNYLYYVVVLPWTERAIDALSVSYENRLWTSTKNGLARAFIIMQDNGYYTQLKYNTMYRYEYGDIRCYINTQ